MSEKQIKRFHRTILFANFTVIFFIIVLFFIGPLKMIRFRVIQEFKKKKSVSSVLREQGESIAILTESSVCPSLLLEKATRGVLYNEHIS